MFEYFFEYSCLKIVISESNTMRVVTLLTIIEWNKTEAQESFSNYKLSFISTHPTHSGKIHPLIPIVSNILLSPKDRESEKSDPNEDKVHRLKGPGVWDEPGAAHMGGKTPIRLAELCEQYMDNLEEYSLYQVNLQYLMLNESLTLCVIKMKNEILYVCTICFHLFRYAKAIKYLS